MYIYQYIKSFLDGLKVYYYFIWQIVSQFSLANILIFVIFAIILLALFSFVRNLTKE